LSTPICRVQIERLKYSANPQSMIFSYSPLQGSREETIWGFAKAMK
jgi:hypothetical protein